jgi:hypothetical protein
MGGYFVATGIGNALKRRAEPNDRPTQLFLPKRAHRRTQVIRRRHEVKFLLTVERHRPSRPTGTDIQAFLRVIRHLVVSQIDEAHAFTLDEMVEHIVLLQHLHVVGQNAENRALPRLFRGHDLDQLFIGVLQILDLHQIVLDEVRAQQAVGAHQKRTMFLGHTDETLV